MTKTTTMTKQEYLETVTGEPPREGTTWAASDPEELYIRLQESNNWEMERWSFYIPLRGNEKAIRALASIVERTAPQGGCFIGEHTPYNIRLVPTPPDKVDALCRPGRRRGYMAYHNRLEGRLDMRSVRAAARVAAGGGDPLYKGGLTGMMRPWGKRRRPRKADWPGGRYESDLKRLGLRDLYKGTAGRLLAPRGWASGGFRGRRPSFQDRCWDATTRLEGAGLRTVGDLAGMTMRQLLAVPDIGRRTAELAEWMLTEAGLGFRRYDFP